MNWRAILAVAILAFLVTGCFTAKQWAAISKYETALANAEARVLAYEEKITAVAADIEAGKIPLASGKALVEQLKAERDQDKAVVTETKNALAEMRAEEVPWWGYIPWREAIEIALLIATGKSFKAAIAERARARAAERGRDELRTLGVGLSGALTEAKAAEGRLPDGATLTHLLKVGASPTLAESVRREANGTG